MIFTLLAVACGSEPAATASPISEPTQTTGPVLPTAQELKQAGKELFSAFFTAVEAQDIATLHSLLVADIRERCSPEQVQQALASDDGLFPELEVKAVYVDLEHPNRALAQVSLLAEPETGLEGFASSIATIFPFPMVQEDGQWRLGLSFFPTGENCPFAEGSSPSETVNAERRQLDATPQPAFPRLAPPPGVRAIASGSGGGRGDYNASALLETDITMAALLEHYRQQVLQPEWKVQQETMDEGLAALTWTFRDEADHPWFGVLLITPAEEGLSWVRLWMGGGAGDGPRMVLPEPREPAVPAPTRPN